ncbi:MAG: glycerol-3-phosphate dehydrogenase [Hyphomicrobiaceae bacterium]
MMSPPTHDLLVIGGGINGAGIARDAAGRGLDVVLCEAGDLAGATSSASSKLIHGGLRYLEHLEFSLVRKALAEREVLLSIAPHIAWPMRFVLPHVPGLRSRWMIRAGLFLYDHLARRAVIPGSSQIRLDQQGLAGVLSSELRYGFSYWDCWVDDARLVVLNVRAAADRGASILTRTRVESAKPENGVWRVTCREEATGTTSELAARVIINAAGPWADRVLADLLRHRDRLTSKPPSLRLVKGSHIVVSRIAAIEDALILQNNDGRVVFVLPYEQNFSLIGTTDVPFAGDPGSAAASEEEIHYLLDVVGRQLAHPPRREDVVHSFAGVRPLYEEDTGKSASSASRDYFLLTTEEEGLPPIVSVFGGKITTYRQLSETVIDGLARWFPALPEAWTASVPLPGGDLPTGGFSAFAADLVARLPGLPARDLHSLARRHGTLAWSVLDGATDVADLGRQYGPGLFEREVVYLRDREWARTAEDILWRRTKCGLHMTPAERIAAAETLGAEACAV